MQDRPNTIKMRHRNNNRDAKEKTGEYSRKLVHIKTSLRGSRILLSSTRNVHHCSQRWPILSASFKLSTERKMISDYLDDTKHIESSLACVGNHRKSCSWT